MIATHATGDFCPIGYVGYIERGTRVRVFHHCDACDEPLTVARCTIEASEEEQVYLFELWPKYSSYYEGQNGRWVANNIYTHEGDDRLGKCYNQMCIEVMAYISDWGIVRNGNYDVKHYANYYKVPLRRPQKLAKNAKSHEEYWLLYCAAYLDFWARLEQAVEQSHEH